MIPTLGRVSGCNDLRFKIGGERAAGRKKKLSSLKRIIRVVDNGAIAKQVPPKQSPMTIAEANACFAAGKDALGIPAITRTGRPRNINNLTWGSALRVM